MCAARYKVTRKIADGGMAELYLGVQRGAAGFERPIVIKRVRAAHVADPATREALVDEAHAAMSLIHSNVVQVLDLGFAAGRYFLVLELVDGWDLSVLLDRARQAGMPMPPALALHVTAEVCRALSFAHARTKDGAPLNIVHRDVNPHNVLVSEQGEVKLTDFGIATGRTRRRPRTLEGVVKGKLGFMSPEQAKGEDALDARSDLFSLGCTLYQAIAGKTPFGGGTELEMLLRMEQCAYEPIEKAHPGLPPDLVALVRKAMQKRPSDRYANADRMLADLERVQRAAFKPAGQSELKAWLAELTRRDRIPTIGRREGTAEAGAPGELAPGETLVLEEIESDPGAAHRARKVEARPVPAPPPALPRPVPPPAKPPARREAEPVEPPGLPGWVFWTAVFVALGVLAMAITIFVARPAPQVSPPAEVVDGGLAALPTQYREPEMGYPTPEDHTVLCESDPLGATVIVNGVPAGATPVGLPLRVGKVHEVRFEKPGFRSQTRRVLVTAKYRPSKISATLEKSTWYLPQ